MIFRHSTFWCHGTFKEAWNIDWTTIWWQGPNLNGLLKFAVKLWQENLSSKDKAGLKQILNLADQSWIVLLKIILKSTNYVFIYGDVRKQARQIW